MYSKIRKKKLKKTTTENLYKPSALLHSEDPDQTPQSVDSDHGIH